MATKLLPALLFVAAAQSPALAHEFWLAPHERMIAPGAEARAELRNGQNFNGHELGYQKRRAERFTLNGAALAPEPGARPAFHAQIEAPGLAVIAYESRFSLIAFDDFAEFRDYVTEEGAPEIAQAHIEAGLPPTPIVERYKRCVKTLIQVGPALPDQRDAPQGLPFEIVALENPFVEGLETLPVQLLWGGEAAGAMQISYFIKGEGEEEAERQTLRADAQGRAEIPLRPGARHMLSAVKLQRAAAPGGAQWESYWASLTF